MFGTQELADIVAAMKEALAAEKYGVAIAAPQIGVGLRIFVVAGHVFAIQKEEDPDTHQYPAAAYFNPRIIDSSRKTLLMNEGCLSVRGDHPDGMLWGNVPRAEKVKIEYQDESGKKKTAGASGLLSQIFQHETDHLEGILYVDKAKELYEDQPES